jgi:membrane-associated phospholipid phosphatase
MGEQVDDKPIEKIEAAASEAARAESEPPRVRRYRAVLFQVSLILVACAFAGLTILVKSMPTFTIDLQITRAIQMINLPSFALLMSLVSWFGFGPQDVIVTGVIILFIYIFGFHWESVVALIAAVFSSGLNILVKDLVQRPRPTSNLVKVFATLKSYSFPSGHVMFYLGFFGFIWFLAFSLLKPSIKRSVILIVLGILVALIGVSRVYLGEHWPSDVLGSYLLGTLSLAAIIQFYLWGKKRFFVRQPVAPAEPNVK